MAHALMAASAHVGQSHHGKLNNCSVQRILLLDYTSTKYLAYTILQLKGSWKEDCKVRLPGVGRVRWKQFYACVCQQNCSHASPTNLFTACFTLKNIHNFSPEAGVDSVLFHTSEQDSVLFIKLLNFQKENREVFTLEKVVCKEVQWLSQ